MSIKKLLCGVSAFSLIASGPASALSLVTAGKIQLAEEHDFDDAPASGDLATITLSTNDFLPVADGYKLTITLTGDVGLNGFDPTSVQGTTTTEISGQIISLDGDDGDKTVTMLFDVDENTVDLLSFDLPVDVFSCDSDVGVSINLTTGGNNPIEGGTAGLLDSIGGDPTAAIECVNAFQVTIYQDDDEDLGAGTQTLLSLASDFEAFLVNADDTTNTALIGNVEIDVDTSAVLGNLTTAVSATHLDDLTFDLVFEDETGFVEVEVNNVDADDTDAPVYAATNTLAAAGTLDITLEVEGDVEILPQQPEVQNAVVAFDGTDLVASETVEVVGFGLDSIDLEGESFGPYDWVGDASKGTKNVFRVTGLTGTPTAVVTITNSSEDDDLNGTYPLDLSTVQTSDANELTIFAADIQGAVGEAFGRADVTFTFFSPDNIDVDRLLSTSGVVSSFGNDADGDD